jgi:hypothetical protein
MNTVKLNGRAFGIKAAWGELSRDDFKIIFGLKMGAAELSAEAKIKILRQLSGIPNKIMMLLSAEQKHRLINLVRWCWKSSISEMPFKYFTIKGVKYFLPAEGFADSSAGEVATFNIYNLEFLKSEDASKKELLFFAVISQLCRPMRADLKNFKKDVNAWNGDGREPFNTSRAEEMAELFFKHGDLNELVVVYDYLMAMNNEFMTRNAELFSGDGGAPVFNGGEGWIALIEDVAGMGRFGDFDKVFDMNGPSLFLHVRMAQKRAKAAERVS